MNYGKPKLEGKTGFDLFMFETFVDSSKKKNSAQVFIINALIIISIGTIIYESYVDNTVETAQAEVEREYRLIERQYPEIVARIDKAWYDKKRYFKLYDELRELRLTSKPDYLLANPAYLDIYEAAANAEAPSLTKIDNQAVHEHFIKSLVYFGTVDQEYALNETYVGFRDNFKAWGDTIKTQHHIKYRILRIVDLTALIFFILEYLASCYVARPKIGKYTLSANGIIDAMAILPSLIEPVIKIVLGSAVGIGGIQIVKILRLLRLMRLLRMLKLATAVVSSDSSDKTPEEWKRTTVKVNLIFALMGLGMCLVMFSALIVFCERGAQPEAFPHIPAGMWWGIITLTSVGYGDIAPVTPAGQIVAGLAGVMSVVVFALLIVATGGVVNEFMSHGAEEEEVGVTASPSEQIATLAGLLEAKHLSQEEFDDKKAKLLDQI